MLSCSSTLILLPFPSSDMSFFLGFLATYAARFSVPTFPNKQIWQEQKCIVPRAICIAKKLYLAFLS